MPCQADNMTYCCQVCRKTFSSRQNLARHKQIHSGVKPFSCSFCHKSFFRRDNLKEHLKNTRCHEGKMSPSEDKSFCRNKQEKTVFVEKETSAKETKCKVKGISLKLKLSTIKQVKKIQPSCQWCRKSFERRCDLRHHLSDHTGVKPYTCLVCTRKFDTLSELKIHLKCHSGEGMHNCDRCQKSFSAPEKLARHSIAHTGEKPYKCSLCSSRFVYFSHLNIHKKTHEPFWKVHICKYCDQTFSSFVSVVIHQRGHGVKRKYSCPVCQRRFAWHSGFKQHILTHSKEKKKRKNKKMKNWKKKNSYPCQTCSKRFPTSNSLSKHLETHLLPNKYTCQACPKSFSCTPALREHIKWKHSGLAYDQESLLQQQHQQQNSDPPIKSTNNTKVIQEHDKDSQEEDYVDIINEDFKPYTQDDQPLTRMRRALGKRPQNRRSSRMKTSVIKCEFCVMTFRDFSLFEKHYQIHMSDKSLLYFRKSSPVSWET